MDKSWNVTFYEDGEPAGERRGLGTDDAVALIYRHSLPGAPFAAAEERIAPETGELELLAA